MAKQTAAAKKAAETKALAEKQAEQVNTAAADISAQADAGAPGPAAPPPEPDPADIAGNAPNEPQPTEAAPAAAPVDNPPPSEELPTPESVMDDDDVDGVWIRSVPESFRRCGYRFTREGLGIALSALTDEQVQALQDEPNLVVEFCTFSESGERKA